MAWLCGNGFSPGDCLDLAPSEDGCPMVEEKMYRMHRDVRIAIAFLEYGSARIYLTVTRSLKSIQ